MSDCHRLPVSTSNSLAESFRPEGFTSVMITSAKKKIDGRELWPAQRSARSHLSRVKVSRTETAVVTPAHLVDTIYHCETSQGSAWVKAAEHGIELSHGRDNR